MNEKEKQDFLKWFTSTFNEHFTYQSNSEKIIKAWQAGRQYEKELLEYKRQLAATGGKNDGWE